MSANAQSNIVAGKPNNNPPSSALSPQLPAGPTSGNEFQRRNGGGGSSTSAGAGATTRGNPRNNQSSRKPHRNHRKPNTPRFDEPVTMSQASSRKGTSITHLINWDVAVPRPQAYHDFRPRNSRRNPTWGLGSGYHAVDKARYINANYRFVVNPVGDYRAQAVDSDVHLQWDQVLQVLASARTQCTNCPICLSEPVAPRMTRCGHIFCLPCLIRYMSSSTEDNPRPAEKKPRYKKCVICTDSVYMNETRPVRFYIGQENEAPREGGDVVLRLLMRKPGSTLALPKDGADPPSELEDIPWHFAAEVMDYARIMKGTEDYMVEQFNREIQELETMEKEDELMFGEEGDWSRKAVSAVRAQIERVQAMGLPPRPVMEPVKLKEKERERRPPIEFKVDGEDVPDMYYVQHEARSGISANSSQPQTPPGIDSPSVEKALSGPISALSASLVQIRSQGHQPSSEDASHISSYFFYQALLHYYLSPLDIRILKTAFGSYNSFPSTILPRVENVTTGHSVDDDLRKRAKYLAHLPYGCEVGFLECDWTDIVPEEILDKFKHEIDKRRKRKKDKESREERDRIRAEREEDEKRWSAARQRRRGSVTRDDFTHEDFVALAPTEVSRPNGVESLSYPSGTSPPWSNNSWESNGGSAFASLASPSTSPAQPRTVWGTPAIAGQSELIAQPRRSSENSGWLQDWEKDLLLEEELLAQMEAEESVQQDSSVGGHAPSHGKGQKKKKFKKVTLMTNGGKRGA